MEKSKHFKGRIYICMCAQIILLILNLNTKIMIKKLIVPIILVFFLSNCNNNAPTQTVATTSVTTPEIIPVDIPQWQLTTMEDSMAIPHTKIQLIYNHPIMLGEGTGHFRVFDKAEYADKKLPKETLSACGGFWAGLEHLIIVIDSSGSWVVKEKFIDEGSDGTETFETFKVINK